VLRRHRDESAKALFWGTPARSHWPEDEEQLKNAWCWRLARGGPGFASVSPDGEKLIVGTGRGDQSLRVWLHEVMPGGGRVRLGADPGSGHIALASDTALTILDRDAQVIARAEPGSYRSSEPVFCGPDRLITVSRDHIRLWRRDGTVVSGVAERDLPERLDAIQAAVLLEAPGGCGGGRLPAAGQAAAEATCDRRHRRGFRPRGADGNSDSLPWIVSVSVLKAMGDWALVALPATIFALFILGIAVAELRGASLARRAARRRPDGSRGFLARRALRILAREYRSTQDWLGRDSRIERIGGPDRNEVGWERWLANPTDQGWASLGLTLQRPRGRQPWWRVRAPEPQALQRVFAEAVTPFRPIAAMGPADLAAASDLERTGTNAEVRQVMGLLRACLELRFGTDVALGGPARAPTTSAWRQERRRGPGPAAETDCWKWAGAASPSVAPRSRRPLLDEGIAPGIEKC
jgi:hypothetical protein